MIFKPGDNCPAAIVQKAQGCLTKWPETALTDAMWRLLGKRFHGGDALLRLADAAMRQSVLLAPS